MMKEETALSGAEAAPLKVATGGKAPRRQSEIGQLKSKFCSIYEAFFKGDNPSTGQTNFWEELLLCKVNVAFLEKCLAQQSEEQLMVLKDNINSIFFHVSCMLQNDNHIRVANALQTLTVLLRGIFKKKFQNFGFDVINLIAGFDNAEACFKEIVQSIQAIIVSPLSAFAMKTLALKLLMVLATANCNINQNALLEYLVTSDVFPTLLTVLSDSSLAVLTTDVLVLLCILINYQKYSAPSHYAKQLAELENEVALNSLGTVLAVKCISCNNDFQSRAEATKSRGLLSSITSMVGSMFASSSAAAGADGEPGLGGVGSAPPAGCGAVLMALYEVVHLNRNFVTLLTHTLPGSLAASVSNSPLMPSAVSPSASTQSLLSVDSGSEHLKHATPVNLISAFFTLSSFVVQDIRTPWASQHAHLCFIILTCVTEDIYANSFLYDQTKHVPVSLYKRPTRHRRGAVPTSISSNVSQPLACSLFGLLISFMESNLKKNLPVQLYSRCMGIVRRMLSYQKKFRLRLDYEWLYLYREMVSLLQFINKHEAHLGESENLFVLCEQVVCAFNMFITFGDTFLPDPAAYDALYYEIIRVHEVFENLNELCKEHISSNKPWKESARRVCSKLTNIKTIIRHFRSKTEEWTAANPGSIITSDQVLAVIRANYDTLTLKLQDSLDHYDKYAENPREVPFFRQSMRSLVEEYSAAFSVAQIDYTAMG